MKKIISFIAILTSIFIMRSVYLCQQDEISLKEATLKKTISNLSSVKEENQRLKDRVSEIKNEQDKDLLIQVKYAYKGNWSDEQLKKRVATEKTVRRVAREQGFKWEDYLVRLVDCESMLGIFKDNKQFNHPATSVDRGPLMFNSYWQSGISDKCSYDLECATKEAIKIINDGRQNRWVCDRKIKNK